MKKIFTIFLLSLVSVCAYADVSYGTIRYGNAYGLLSYDESSGQINFTYYTTGGTVALATSSSTLSYFDMIPGAKLSFLSYATYDGDNDGISDWSEIYYNGNLDSTALNVDSDLDTDGDGYSDYDELNAGSDPFDASSFGSANSSEAIDTSFIDMNLSELLSTIVSYIFGAIVIGLCIGLGIWLFRKVCRMFKSFSR